MHYHFVDAARVRAAARLATRCSNGPRCTAIATARRASRSRRRWREGRDMLFDIDWQGALQLKEKMRGRHRLDLHPAAVDGGAEGAPEAPRRGSATRSSSRGWRTPAPRSSTGASMTTSSSTTISTAPSPRCARSSPPSACAATAGRACSISSRGLLDEKTRLTPRPDQQPKRVGQRARIPRRPASRRGACRRCRPRRAARSPPRLFRLCRSILRRWPKAASVTRSSFCTSAGSGLGARHEVDDRRGDLRRRREGLRRHVEGDAAPRCASRRARRAGHRRRRRRWRRCARPPRAGTSASATRQKGGQARHGQPADQQFGADVVGQVGDDLDRARRRRARRSRSSARRRR